MDNPQTTCVVIGGQTFIGRHLVHRLLKLGNWIVKIADTSPGLILEPHSPLYDAVSSSRASYFCIDVRDKSSLLKALDGSALVFYVVSADASTCDLYECYKLIVQGAKNVITACQECKVKRLVYNGSADVVFDGSHHIRNGNESLRYPWKYEDVFLEMKAQAETMILSANDNTGLLTCALRPSNVFGPDDTQIVRFLVKQSNSLWAKVILGSGDNLSDFTYVENVAHAHMCAAEALVNQTFEVAGKAFFITNLEPKNYWHFASRLYERFGYQRPSIRLPFRLVNFMLPVVRWTRSRLGSEVEVAELLSYAQFILESALFTRTFNCSAAKEHIKYSPVVSVEIDRDSSEYILARPLLAQSLDYAADGQNSLKFIFHGQSEEGLSLTVKSLPHSIKSSAPSREDRFIDEISKSEEILGYGKVADVLLWRDEMETFSYFLLVVGLFYWFFLSGRTFISSTAGLLLLGTFFLIVNNVLPFNIFQKMPLPLFEVSETTPRKLLEKMAFVWNKGTSIVKSVAQGEDWTMLFKAAVPLYFLKVIISQSLAALVGAVLIFAFTSFFIYEQYEEEIDRFFMVAAIVAKCSLIVLLRTLPAPVASFLCPDDDDELCDEVAQPILKEQRL